MIDTNAVSLSLSRHHGKMHYIPGIQTYLISPGNSQLEKTHVWSHCFTSAVQSTNDQNRSSVGLHSGNVQMQSVCPELSTFFWCSLEQL